MKLKMLILLALVLIDILDLNDQNFQVHLTSCSFFFLLAVFITPLSYCIYGASFQKKVVIQELYLSN